MAQFGPNKGDCEQRREREKNESREREGGRDGVAISMEKEQGRERKRKRTVGGSRYYRKALYKSLKRGRQSQGIACDSFTFC